MLTTWPAHSTMTEPWTPSERRGSRADRTLTAIEVSVPPSIGDLNFDPVGEVARAHEAALIAVATLEAGYGQHLAPLGDFLLRTESVASSKIEHIDAGWSAFGKAMVGARASSEARSQLAAVRALTELVESSGRGPITRSAILGAHRVLMSPSDYIGDAAGQLRSVQNWIGGSDYTPINALFVPPPAGLVDDLMTDLLTFANRDDLPILAQAAIAHAQFLSIHPFTDGNGRIGRALLAAILRRRGLTARITVPLASVMLADTQRYFDKLTDYRDGAADAFVGYVAQATIHACAAAEESAGSLSALPQRWREIACPRADSAESALIERLLDTPIFDAADAVAMTGRSEVATYNALNRLTEAGILDLLSANKRNRVWAAGDVLAELDALTAAIGRRATLASGRGKARSR